MPGTSNRPNRGLVLSALILRMRSDASADRASSGSSLPICKSACKATSRPFGTLFCLLMIVMNRSASFDVSSCSNATTKRGRSRFVNPNRRCCPSITQALLNLSGSMRWPNCQLGYPSSLPRGSNIHLFTKLIRILVGNIPPDLINRPMSLSRFLSIIR